jgi:hypothetical protein
VLVDEPLADHFRGFAAVAERDGGSVYPAICRSVAEDDEVLSLLDHAPRAQRRPLILLASVHDLLLAGADHPLAAHYDTVASIRGVPFHSPGSDVAVDFADFCRIHRGELEYLISSRTTQTNEVGRCTSLLPALCHVAAGYPASTPLSLLDLGTSAGLNLLFDDYGYAYHQEGGGRTIAAGPSGAAVALECRARGDLGNLPPLRVPTLAGRVGLDLSPVDARSEVAARWLLACQWPENPARFARLRGALANLRASDHPPRLERGDMVDDVARVAATVEGDGPLVVFHSWVAAYLDEERQRSLVAAVAALDRPGRPVHHLYCETALETPGLPTPPSPMTREGPDLSTALVHIAAGGAEPVRLADTHPHGYWIRWWPQKGLGR